MNNRMRCCHVTVRKQMVYFIITVISLLLLIFTRSNFVDMWKTKRVEISSNRIFKRLISPTSSCVTPKLLLVISVSSSVGHKDRRDAIRNTWGQENILHEQHVSLLFLLGSTQDHQTQMAVSEEAESHGDILQGDFLDTYNNLTLKSIMALRWTVSNCPQATYFMKTDDDIFLNTKQIVKFLGEFGRKRWIAGCIKQFAAPKPIMPGFANMKLPFPGHPNFVAGAGYILSSDILEALLHFALVLPLVPVEDAFITAYCARELGIFPSHFKQFSCGEILQKNCDMTKKFVGHHISPERQYEIWKDLQNVATECSEI